MADKMVVTAESLQDLVDPKNPALLDKLGKVEGLAKILRMWLGSLSGETAHSWGARSACSV